MRSSPPRARITATKAYTREFRPALAARGDRSEGRNALMLASFSWTSRPKRLGTSARLRVREEWDASEDDTRGRRAPRRGRSLEKERLEAALEEKDCETPEASMDEIADTLKRLPDLSEELRAAPTELKRQVFEAFQLRIAYDKLERRITISATVSEAVAEAFHNAKDLPQELHRVAQRDIAGAGFEPATFGL